MITAESSTSIARPASEVFEFVSDLRNDPQWHTDILEARLAGDGPIGQGATFAIRFKPFMGKSEERSPFRSTSRRVASCSGDRWARWLQRSSSPSTLMPRDHVSRAGSRWSHPGSCG